MLVTPQLLYSSNPRIRTMVVNSSPGVRAVEPYSASLIVCNISTAINYAMDYIPGFREVTQRQDFNVNIHEVADIETFLRETQAYILPRLSKVYAATIPLGTPTAGILRTDTFIDKSRIQDLSCPEKLLSTVLHEAALITFFANTPVQTLQKMSSEDVELEVFKTHIQALEAIMHLQSSTYSQDRLQEVLKEERRFAASWA